MRWTQARLSRTMRKWQLRFGLTAWTITVSFTDLDSLQASAGEIAYGDIQYESLQRVAHIRVISPKFADRFVEPLPKPNPEEIVIHELLHLVTDPVVKRVGSDPHEQLINMLTALLINKD